MHSSSSRQALPRRAPVVGREREQALLQQLLDDALAGHGSLVLVSGEAGIGKTTLVEWLAREAEIERWLVLRGGCYDLSVTPPYGPWLELLEAYPRSRSIPPLPAFVTDPEAIAALGNQDRLFAAGRDFFFSLAVQQSLVLILEDLHWSDQTSLDFLRVLGRRVADHRILIIATYRSDELHRQHPLYARLPQLVREGRAERINVRPLDDLAQRELILSRYTLSEPDQQRLETYLGEHADGNPFFAGELLRSLEEAGTLSQVSNGWVVSDLRRLQLPSLLRRVIESRLDRMGNESRILFQIAAIIGQEVPLALWQQISGASDTALEMALDHGLSAQLITETVAESCRFRHAIFRKALYDEVIAPRRQQWHQAVADALSTTSNPDPDTVAYHYQQCGDSRASDWLIRAGERAQRRFAWLAAADRFQMALTLLPVDTSTQHQRAWLFFRIGLLARREDPLQSVAFLEEALLLAIGSGNAALEHLVGAHIGLVQSYSEVAQSGMHEMDASVKALEQLDETQQQELEHIERLLGPTIGIQGRGTLALQLAKRGHFQTTEAMLNNYRARGPVDVIDGNWAAGMIEAYLGHPERARQIFMQCLEDFVKALKVYNHDDTCGETAWEYFFVQIPYATEQTEQRQRLASIVQGHWANESSIVTDPDDADVAYTVEFILSGDWKRALAVLDHPMVRSPYVDALFRTWRLKLADYRGDREMVSTEIRIVLPDGPGTEPGNHSYCLTDELTRLAIKQALDDGDRETAHDWLSAHDRLLAWSGAVLGKAENALLWARYQDARGDARRSRKSAEDALAHATDPRQPLALIAVHRFLGYLDTLDRHFNDAEQHLQESLRLAENCAARFERSLSVLQMAELRLAQGKAGETMTLLDEVQAICTPLEASPTLERVASLRQQLTQRLRSAPQLPAGLSPREVEVLRVVAQGLTDAEIAAKLFISRRTVTSHMTSVYNKIGIGSRTAAAVWAKEHDLL